jgi:hypothetical protein
VADNPDRAYLDIKGLLDITCQEVVDTKRLVRSGLYVTIICNLLLIIHRSFKKTTLVGLIFNLEQVVMC